MLSFIVFSLCLALVQSRTIKWNAAGGNTLWNNPGNWDCSCLPTIDDDVVIDHQNGNVLVGGVAPALCKSLTLGGNSGFPQVLTLTTAITVGTGNSVLQPNGQILMKSAPEYPFQNAGTFTVHGNGFQFSSGTLSGSGSWVFETDSVFNLTDSATKALSTSVMVKGKAITYTDRSSNIVLTGATLTISGTFTSTAALTMSTDMTSKFKVTGSFAYKGSSLLLQGSGFNFDNWSLDSGSSVTVSNTFTSGTLALASGATLTLIGAPSETRTFATITGSGTIQNQGGANNFNMAAGATFQATGGKASVTSGTFQKVTVAGAYLGGGKISTQALELTTGFINSGLQISTGTLLIQGTIELDDDGTSVTVSQSGSIPINSLITMTGGSSLAFNAGSTVTQGGTLQIVPGAPKPKKPTVTINGAWTSNAQLTVAEIPVGGNGAYTIANTGSFNLNNVVFTANSINSAGSIQNQIGSFTVDTITGTGSITASPLTMNIAHLGGNQFTLNSGTVTVSNLTLSTLDMKNGVFGLATTGKVNTWKFEGGQFKGTQSSQATLSVRDTTLTGLTTQTLTNTAVTTNTFTMNCGNQACQFFTQNANVRTTTQ